MLELSPVAQLAVAYAISVISYVASAIAIFRTALAIHRQWGTLVAVLLSPIYIVAWIFAFRLLGVLLIKAIV